MKKGFIGFIFIAQMFNFSLCQNPSPQMIPCLQLNASALNSFTGTKSANCIEVGGDENNPVEIDDNNIVYLHAGNMITLKYGTYVHPGIGGEFQAKIVSAGITPVWYEPVATPGFVGKYEKLELGFKLSDNINSQIDQFLLNHSGGINPFNPDEIDFETTFTSPTGHVKKVLGFYYIPYSRDMVNNNWKKDTTSYNWRVRFAPDETGTWNIAVNVTTASGTVSYTTGLSFVCVASSKKGRIKRSYNETEADRYLYYSETGETFFAIGHNIAHSGYTITTTTPISSIKHLNWIQQLADNGGNFYRLELGGENALPDWDQYDDYSDQYNDQKMAKMWEYDQVISLSEQLNLYFVFFRHHVEVTTGQTWENINWQNNPYKIGFNLSSREEYFTNPNVIKWQNNAQRYIFARWGYSPSFSIYEYSEIEGWVKDMEAESGLSEHEAISKFKTWFVSQKNYINNELDNTDVLFSCTYASEDYEKDHVSDGLFSQSDIIGFHKYGSEKGDNYRGRYNKAVVMWTKWEKPFIIEEIGHTTDDSGEMLPIYCCTDIDFHNAIWSTSMMGAVGTGMHWWWDRGIHDFAYYQQYQNVQSFFEGEDLRGWKYNPQEWKDNTGNSVEGTMLENYALKSENKERVLGWVHNATYYWRNLYDDSSCIKELVDNGVLPSPCIMEDGYILGGNNTTNPFDDEKYEDHYTFSGGTQPIYSGLGSSNNPIFKIKGLKTNLNQVYNPWAKKHWYKVSFYTTRGYPYNPPVEIQILHTNILYKLKPHVPNMTATNPDYSYKVEYMGKFQDAPSAKSLEITDSTGRRQVLRSEEEVLPTNYITPVNDPDKSPDVTSVESAKPENRTGIVIYPNPNQGTFSIQADNTIQNIMIFNIKGEIIFNKDNVMTDSYTVSLINPVKGIYLLQVMTLKVIYSQKLIIE